MSQDASNEGALCTEGSATSSCTEAEEASECMRRLSQIMAENDDASHSSNLKESTMVDAQFQFPVGSMVRLVGLRTQRYNGHVGQVVEHAKNGRLGIKLHGVVWKDELQSRRGERSVAERSVAVHPQNARLTKDPKTLPAPTQLDSVSRSTIMRLIGERGLGLPDIIAENISNRLTIPWVSSVSIVGCSTNRGDFPLSAILDDDDSTWWISEEFSMPSGEGNEWLEFSFGTTPRRVSFVGMKIPPLPFGPLSVRDFHLLALTESTPTHLAVDQQEGGTWAPASPVPLQTLDLANLQEYAIVPPVETTRLRLVCTRNAAADSDQVGLMSNCIGLFQVAFA